MKKFFVCLFILASFSLNLVLAKETCLCDCHKNTELEEICQCEKCLDCDYCHPQIQLYGCDGDIGPCP